MLMKGLMGTVLAAVLAVTTTVQADEARGTIGEILSREQLILMNNLAAAPWQFRDAKGDPAGFSVDLNRMIAARLGVDLHMIDTDWAGLIPGMLAHKTDFIASTMSTTFPRAQQVLFTTASWYKTGTVAYVKPDAKYDNWESLNDPSKKVAVKAGTSGVEVANRYFPKAQIQTYPSDVDLYQALQAGRVDMLLGDKAVAKRVQKDYGFTVSHQPRELISSDSYGFTVRPGDTFTWQYLNFFLTRIAEDGELDALNKYWADGDQWETDFLKKNDHVSQERIDLVNFLGIKDYTPETGGKRTTLE